MRAGVHFSYKETVGRGKIAIYHTPDTPKRLVEIPNGILAKLGNSLSVRKKLPLFWKIFKSLFNRTRYGQALQYEEKQEFPSQQWNLHRDNAETQHSKDLNFSYAGKSQSTAKYYVSDR